MGLHTHTCNHEVSEFTVNRVRNYDPTGTTKLRDDFARDMRVRFEELRREVLQAVIVDDIFGLAPPSITSLATLIDNQSPGKRAYAFQTDEQKVLSFVEWLNQGAEDKIFTRRDRGLKRVYRSRTVFPTNPNRWTDVYIDSAYQKGIRDARQNLIRQGLVTETTEIGRLRDGAFTETFNTPIHIERVSVLFTRTFETLKGVSADMSRDMSQILSQGLIEGKGPREVGRSLASVIDKKYKKGLSLVDSRGRYIPSKVRGEMIARTEIIRAHHLGNIQELKSFGVDKVGVKAEWITAGDDRVCQQCLDKELAGPYLLTEVEGMIPLHPRCRCVIIPLRISPQRATTTPTPEGPVPDTPAPRRRRATPTVPRRRRARRRPEPEPRPAPRPTPEPEPTPQLRGMSVDDIPPTRNISDEISEAGFDHDVKYRVKNPNTPSLESAVDNAVANAEFTSQRIAEKHSATLARKFPNKSERERLKELWRVSDGPDSASMAISIGEQLEALRNLRISQGINPSWIKGFPEATQKQLKKTKGWVQTDSGRTKFRDADFLKRTNTGDCVTRAFCNAGEGTYVDVWQSFTRAKVKFDTADLGMSESVYGKMLTARGFEVNDNYYSLLTQIGNSRRSRFKDTVRKFAKNTEGDDYEYVLIVGRGATTGKRGHVVYVTDGKWFDSWDSGSWYVKGVYKRKKKQ